MTQREGNEHGNLGRWLVLAHVAYAAFGFLWLIGTLGFTITGGGFGSEFLSIIWLVYLWSFFPVLIGAMVMTNRSYLVGNADEAKRWTALTPLWTAPAVVLLLVGMFS